MSTILYPTRGGTYSYKNQDKIIAIAKEQKANLIFLYVSNVEFLGSVTGHVLVDIVADELDHLGEFLLAMAQERATNAGWQADAIIRRGNFREAIWEIITNQNITTLGIGASGQSNAVTTPKFLEELMESIVEEFGIEVIVLGDGEIIDRKSPQTTDTE